MSVGKKQLAPRRRQQEGEQDEEEESNSGGGDRNRKEEARYGRCFSGLELSIGPGPLKDVDAGKLKDQIKRWARAVVAYARQLSFGSPRSTTRSSSSRGRATTAMSATFPSKSHVDLGGAKDEPEPPP